MLKVNKALKLQEIAVKLAEEKSSKIAVAVTDSVGELISFVKMDGVAPHAAVLAQNKAYTAARDRQTTKSLANWASDTNKDLSYWTDSRFTGIAGGIPIQVDGSVVGAIGISGMSEEDDENLGFEALSLLNKLFS